MSRRTVTRDGRAVWLRPAIEEDAAGLIRAIDSVAREQVYFIRSRFEVDEEQERDLIARARERGDLILVAVLDGEIVGWVTLFRAQAEFLRHTAQLGIGVVEGFRDIGIGASLMEYTLDWAAEHGLEKVSLGVRASNERALALYRKFGFVQEGYRVRDIKDRQGRYDDKVEMACFISQAPPPARGVGEPPSCPAGGHEE